MDLSRRGMMSAALGAPLLGSQVKAEILGQPANLRSRFNLAPDLLFFNAANIAAGFTSAYEAERAAALSERTNPSFENRAQFNDVAATLRQRIAEQIKAPVAGVALTRNSSEANTIIVRGLPLKAGDEVIVGRENHESNTDGWTRRAKREGLVIKVAQHAALPKTQQEVVDAFAAQITPRTRVISFSHASNVAGLIIPVAQIAAIARPKGVWVHVDGAQSYGVMQINVDALGCDSFAGSSQKWLMGPIGAGMLYVRPDRIAEIDAPVLSHGYWRSGPPTAVNGQAFEQLGQSDDAKLVGYLATLDARALIGEAAIEQIAFSRAAGLRRRLDAKGVKVGGSGDPALWGPVLAVVPSGDVGARREALWKSDRLACAPGRAGTERALRISPHIYNSDAELDRLAALLA